MPHRLVRAVVALVLTVASVPVGAAHVTAAEPRRAAVQLSASAASAPIGSWITLRGRLRGSDAAHATVQTSTEEGWRSVGRMTVNDGRGRLPVRLRDGANRFRLVVGPPRGRTTSAVLTIQGIAPPMPPPPDDVTLVDFPTWALQDDFLLALNERRSRLGFAPLLAHRRDLREHAQRWAEARRDSSATDPPPRDDAALPDLVVTGEWSLVAAMPEQAVADAVAAHPELLTITPASVGIGVAVVDPATAHWTVVVADAAPPTVWSENEVRTLVLDRTNAFRAEHGLPPLLPMPELDAVAQSWARHMADEDVFVHNPDYFGAYPGRPTGGGENIARWQMPEEVVDAWIASAGHRGNLLGDYTHLGIGFATNPDSTHQRYYVQNFARY